MDNVVGHIPQFRGLADKILTAVATCFHDGAFHRNELPLPFRIQRTVGLIGKERLKAGIGRLGDIQGNRAGQTFVHPDTFTTGHHAQDFLTPFDVVKNHDIERLADIASVNLKEYGLAMLRAGAGIGDKTPAEIAKNDLKEFKIGDYRIIAKIEDDKVIIFVVKIEEESWRKNF